MSSSRLVSAFIAVTITSACASGPAVDQAPVAPLDTVPFAINDIQGAADDNLIVAFGAAVQEASGAPIVTRLAVRREVQRCGAGGDCGHAMRDTFAAAPLVIDSTLTAAGRGFIASGTGRMRATVVLRTSASGRTARQAVVQLGFAVGAMAREAVQSGEVPRAPEENP